MDQSESAGKSSACCTTAASGPAQQNADGETTLAALGHSLEQAKGLGLAFTYAGRTTKPGYHITELKSARITGLDCGANVESWSETIFQLWDIEDSVTGEVMTVDKLLGIIAKYTKLLNAEPNSRLSFEVSEDGEAMRIFGFDRMSVSGGVATIHLGTRAAACKPLVRGILTPIQGKGACGGPKTAFASEVKKATCCG